MNKKIINSINEFLASGGVETYVSHAKERCFRTFAPLSWYFLFCDKLGLTPERTSDYSFGATIEDSYLSMDFVEGDVILSIGHQLSKDYIYNKCGEYLELRQDKNTHELKIFDIETTKQCGIPLMFGTWGNSWGDDNSTETICYAKI